MGVPIPMRTGIGVILAGGMVLSAFAQQKPTLPDAQVEANVLRALASAPELSTQNIQTTTVYGVVTLSGSANDEASRTRAENLAARAEGVKKVVDEMGIGVASANGDAQNQPAISTSDPAQGQNGALVLQSDGTYAPASASDQAAPLPQQSNNPNGAPLPPQNAQSEPGYGAPPAPPANGQYPPQANGNRQYPPQANGNGKYPPQADGQYPPQANGQYPPVNGRPYPPRRPMYSDNRGQYPPVPGGQVGGRSVTIPSGALLRIRINQGLSTRHTQPGSVFDATVLNDVVADGAIAIPRGASAQGTVVEVKDAGALKGRGELALELTRLMLGGQTYALVSDTWTRSGADKSLRTVNSALGLGALGAVIGAVAGGGEGAAVGAGVGGAAGIASSASSQGGRVVVPPEAVLTFHLVQAATVATVSEQEMARLSYAAGPNWAGPPVARRRYYPAPYSGPYGPNYYPRY